MARRMLPLLLVLALCLPPRAARAAGLYAEDESKTIRKSHENPDIQKLYAEFLGEPNGHLAHKLLHTEYIDRSDG